MKARIYSSDRNTTEILTPMLKAFGYGETEVVAPASIAGEVPQDYDQHTLILDLDDKDCVESLWSWSDKYCLLFIGQQQPKNLDRLYTSPTGTTWFLRKPFAEERVRDTLTRLLQDEAACEMGVGTKAKPRAGKLPSELLQIERDHAERTSMVRLALESKPPQLVGLMEQGKLTPDDMPLKSALVLERDDSFASVLSQYLMGHSVMEMHRTDKGLDAWKRIKSGSYDVFIMNWDMDDMPAVTLYNRLRAGKTYRHLPVLVTCSDPENTDLRLLEDDHCLQIVQKPLQRQEFSDRLLEIVVNGICLGQLEDKAMAVISGLLKSGGHPGKISTPFARFLIMICRRVAGECIRTGDFDLAEKAFDLSCSYGDQSTMLMTGLAKVYHCQKRHSKAKRLVARANILAPGHISRLCLKGEIDLWLNDFDDALAAFQEVLHYDPDNKKAKSGQDMVMQIQDNPMDPRAQLENQLASPLNLTAIYLARQGKYRDALRYYLCAFSFVHTVEDQAKLLFNIGLCYKRAGRDDQAAMAFQRAVGVSGGSFEKATKYLVSPDEDDDDLEEFEDEVIGDPGRSAS